LYQPKELGAGFRLWVALLDKKFRRRTKHVFISGAAFQLRVKDGAVDASVTIYCSSK
jgi:hypothetical protein